MLDAATEHAMLDAIREHGPRGDEALRALVDAHRRMVVSIASRYARLGIDAEDLVAEGILGLLEAARRYDPSHGARFCTYAVWWVRARISHFALQNRRAVAAPSTRGARRLGGNLGAAERAALARTGHAASREELARRTHTSVQDVELVQSFLQGRDVPVGSSDDEVDVPDGIALPDDAVATDEWLHQLARRIHGAMSALGPREREIVRRRLLADEPETLATIGHRLGISRERVRQLETLARDRLRMLLDDCHVEA